MSAQDLLDILEHAIEQYGPDIEVRLAHQPSYPFEYTTRDAVLVEPLKDNEEPIIYIVEGAQIGYLPAHVAEEIGWR